MGLRDGYSCTALRNDTEYLSHCPTVLVAEILDSLLHSEECAQNDTSVPSTRLDALDLLFFDKYLLFNGKDIAIMQERLGRFLAERMKAMWNDHRSLILSKVCAVVFMGCLLGVAGSAPWLVRWLVGFSRADLAGWEPLFLSTIYTGSLTAARLLLNLYRLL